MWGYVIYKHVSNNNKLINNLCNFYIWTIPNIAVPPLEHRKHNRFSRAFLRLVKVYVSWQSPFRTSTMARPLATVGILSIGSMGAGVARLLAAHNYRVITNASGRR